MTFLQRFTFVTLVVSAGAAVVLAYTLELAHRNAISTDFEAAALGRVNALLTKPLERAGNDGRLSPATTASLNKIADDVRYFQNVTGMRVYRPNGVALYPAGAAGATSDVARAMRSDTLLRVQRGDTITAYSPYFTTSERIFVIAVDFSAGQLSATFRHERRLVFGVVSGVVVVIFLSLVTLAAGASREIERRRREARASFVEVLALMADTIELRDPYTAGHSTRVAAYSRKLGEALGLSASDLETLFNAALLHDIGKIAVPDNVLFKPSPLDEHERAIMSRHPQTGGDLLARLSAMDEIASCVAHHHERIDGKGYPGKLASLAIPRGARIIAVADTFDAMTTDRPYRRALSVASALAELERVSGTQLDAAMVAALIRLVKSGSIVPPKPFESAGDPAFGRSGLHAAASERADLELDLGGLLAAGRRPNV